MSNVMFDEEPRYTRTGGAEQAKEGSIIGLMYRLGIVRTRKDANIVMGGIIAVCLVVSATLFMFVQPHQDPAKAAELQKDVAHMNDYQKNH